MVANLALLLSALGLASATSLSTREHSIVPRKVVVGGAGQLLSFDFNGDFIGPITNSSNDGRNPSWMMLKEPNLLYTVDENSNLTSVFIVDPVSGILSNTALSTVNGSSGLVYLAFNSDKTRMVGASYGEGTIDIYDVSTAEIKLLRKMPLPRDGLPAETKVQAHQAVLDPSGRFFAIPDLGGNRIHFVDSYLEYGLAGYVELEAGHGPRHGAWLSLTGSAMASHFVVVTETTNTVQLFTVALSAENKVSMTHQQTVSTFGDAFPAANLTAARAGELLVSSTGHVYVSNRLSGHETDSISHFALDVSAAGLPELVFKDQVSTAGVSPRQLSFSKDESLLFGVNMQGANALFAFERCADTGALGPEPVALRPQWKSAEDLAAGWGPAFIMEL